jgi:hypothetical protein
MGRQKSDSTDTVGSHKITFIPLQKSQDLVVRETGDTIAKHEHDIEGASKIREYSVKGSRLTVLVSRKSSPKSR